MLGNQGRFPAQPTTLTQAGRVRVALRLARDVAIAVGVILAVPILLTGLLGLALWVWTL